MGGDVGWEATQTVTWGECPLAGVPPIPVGPVCACYRAAVPCNRAVCARKLGLFRCHPRWNAARKASWQRVGQGPSPGRCAGVTAVAEYVLGRQLLAVVLI